MPCKICGSTTQTPESASHINTNRHQAALKQLNKITLAKSSEQKLEDFDRRINFLENQIDTVTTKLAELEEKMTKPSDPSQSPLQISRSTGNAIQRAIMQILSEEKSINLDTLEKKLPFNWHKIEIVLNNLYDSKVIVGGEDRSKRKLKGYIGKISRN